MHWFGAAWAFCFQDCLETVVGNIISSRFYHGDHGNLRGDRCKGCYTMVDVLDIYQASSTFHQQLKARSGSSTFREGIVNSIVFLSRKLALARLKICKHSDGQSSFSFAFQASFPDNLGLVENVGAVHYDVSRLDRCGRKVYLNLQGPDLGNASDCLSQIRIEEI